jgi:hypothetical protein
MQQEDRQPLLLHEVSSLAYNVSDTQFHFSKIHNVICVNNNYSKIPSICHPCGRMGARLLAPKLCSQLSKNMHVSVILITHKPFSFSVITQPVLLNALL